MGALYRQVARLATRWHEVPLGFPGGVAERSESFKMMIAGGNHTVIKKLLSVARLMRGGDRLIQECSWMNGICFSFHHSTCCCRDFKRSPPLIRLFCQSVPKCRLSKNPASPRGKPRGRLRELAPFNLPICSGNSGELRAPIIYKLFTHAIVL